MRNVTLVIAKLGLSIGDSIKLQLVDKLGNVFISTQSFSLDEDIILSTSSFEIELLENDTIVKGTFYKLTLPNKIVFNFSLSSIDGNAPHDLLALLKMACYRSILRGEYGATFLDTHFVTKLNLYFTGQNPHFTATQKSLVDLYEYYADEIIDTSSTIDIVAMLDVHLTTITEEIV